MSDAPMRANCPHCSLYVGHETDICPRCGSKVQKSREFWSLPKAIASILVVAAFLIWVNGDKSNTVASPQSATDPIDVALSLELRSGNPPSLVGTTNLPEGTEIAIFLAPVKRGDGLPACSPNCGFSTFAHVHSMQFYIGPELTGNRQIPPDLYELQLIVNPMAVNQPGTVTARIGQRGENLRGPFVVASRNHEFVHVSYPTWHPDPSSDEYILGLSLNYTQRLRVEYSNVELLPYANRD